MKALKSAIAIVVIGLAAICHADQEPIQVQIDTSMGTIVVELNAKEAPKTVANFLDYLSKGYYNGTIFHRVIKGFMIQGGGFTADMKHKPAGKPILNEAHNGLRNETGTIAMARTPHPHSASSQFFINVADNAFLNHRDKSTRGWGYCVFGRVIKGMQVVHAIEAVDTVQKAGHRDVPNKPVVIKHMRRLPLAKNQPAE